MILLNIEDFKRARITIGLIILNIACFFMFINSNNDTLFLLLVQDNRRLIENLEIWRLFTAMFLHADITHLFSNMLSLLIFGTTIETYYKVIKIRYILIYFISGLIGNLFSLVFLPLDSYSLGASGAILGLIGFILIMIIYDDRSLLLFTILYIAYFLFASFSPGINIWAHIFGFLGGLLFGFFMNYNSHKKLEFQ
ncbi:MAG: rhomboid family intramembrane serine protease [Candidatus Lokiarchaeota archaeon]|nr:rhomboid family intramembrane serine protease [Candidatus Lokiarchaeota archaeon]